MSFIIRGRKKKKEVTCNFYYLFIW